ncbi:MAG TPA: tRNA (adenosine(37)-N6)-threonylcarbamoyltransferase complex ATPase subunit type 1 TsaE [Ignavibacteriaceae bacterium]|nr:tRNA (adenosine(37)-N6)-threonylcarbamoyltransferase complex ATPase subunit type 1 TsaE [Ignavibacteriaceae bacterium]
METIELAKSLSENISAPEVVVLNGELGSGKTFFIKHLLKCFGVQNVSSPTFAIVNEYTAKFDFYHFDFYRINKENELIEIGFNDYLVAENSVVLIEWGSLFPNLLPKKRIEISIRVTEEFSREFEFGQL